MESSEKRQYEGGESSTGKKRKVQFALSEPRASTTEKEPASLGGMTAEELDFKFDKDAVERIRRNKREKAAGMIEAEDRVDLKELDVLDDVAAKGEKSMEEVSKRKRAYQNRIRLQQSEEADPECLQDDDGTIFEPFNMKQEMKEGSIDADGHFLYAKKTSTKDPDRWLDSLSEATIADGLREKVEKEAEEFSRPFEKVDVAAVLTEIYGVLRRGETPKEAMRRMRKENKNTKLTGDVLDKFNLLSDLSHKLLSAGKYVYDDTKEDIYDGIEAQAQQEVFWLMRDKKNPDAVEGPFTNNDLTYWIVNGLLSEDVEVMQCAEDGKRDTMEEESWMRPDTSWVQPTTVVL